MDYVEDRDFADQGPLTDMDLEEDVQILATLSEHIPSCMHTADIEKLLQDIPVQVPLLAVQVRHLESWTVVQDQGI